MAFGFDNVIAAGLQIINKFVPDPAEKIKAESELRASLLAWDTAQSEVNKTEAGSANLFVSGWRPSIGWVCSLALFYQYLLVPISVWIALWTGHIFPKPPILDDTLWQLMFGMLGMGGLRTFEKIKGISK